MKEDAKNIDDLERAIASNSAMLKNSRSLIAGLDRRLKSGARHAQKSADKEAGGRTD